MSNSAGAATRGLLNRLRRRVQFIADVYVPEVHAGVVDYARAAGWALFDGKCYYPASTREEKCDGMLAIIGRLETTEMIARRGCPVVRLLCSEEGAQYAAVETDGEAAGACGAEHLLSLGAVTCAFYRLGKSRETDRMWRGFSGVIGAAGRQAHLLDGSTGLKVSEIETTPRSARWESLAGQLSQLPRPLAVMVEDDRFVDDVFEAAALLGWQVPQDIAILGTDNRKLILGKLPITISSVDTNLRGVGWAGAALLDRLMRGEERPADPLLIPPDEVVARQSTATFISDHMGLNRAVNFLRTHFVEPLHLPELARTAGLSVRSLQTAFKAQVGHTLSDEITRLRLLEALRLLRETNLKLESVALECGLGNAKYLCRVFRAQFGGTPAAYRDRHRSGKRDDG